MFLFFNHYFFYQYFTTGGAFWNKKCDTRVIDLRCFYFSTLLQKVRNFTTVLIFIGKQSTYMLKKIIPLNALSKSEDEKAKFFFHLYKRVDGSSGKTPNSLSACYCLEISVLPDAAAEPPAFCKHLRVNWKNLYHQQKLSQWKHHITFLFMLWK